MLFYFKGFYKSGFVGFILEFVWVLVFDLKFREGGGLFRVYGFLNFIIDICVILELLVSVIV